MVFRALREADGGLAISTTTRTFLTKSILTTSGRGPQSGCKYLREIRTPLITRSFLLLSSPPPLPTDNRCNSTTEGPDSLCQTAVINSIDGRSFSLNASDRAHPVDFCLWGAPGLSSNQSIGDVEAAVVAYVSCLPRHICKPIDANARDTTVHPIWTRIAYLSTGYVHCCSSESRPCPFSPSHIQPLRSISIRQC